MTDSDPKPSSPSTSIKNIHNPPTLYEGTDVSYEKYCRVKQRESPQFQYDLDRFIECVDPKKTFYAARTLFLKKFPDFRKKKRYLRRILEEARNLFASRGNNQEMVKEHLDYYDEAAHIEYTRMLDTQNSSRLINVLKNKEEMLGIRKNALINNTTNVNSNNTQNVQNNTVINEAAGKIRLDDVLKQIPEEKREKYKAMILDMKVEGKKEEEFQLVNLKAAKGRTKEGKLDV